MKPSLPWASLLGLAVTLAGVSAFAAESSSRVAAVERVGVYDSRALAYAHFWSAAETQTRNATLAAGKAAQAAGDAAKVRELSAQIAAAQERSHQQVFGTAPADDAMAALKEQIPAIQREMGVTQLVSKWDGTALKGVPESQRVDVTDRLVREFELDPKRLKTLEELRKSKPSKASRIRNT